MGKTDTYHHKNLKNELIERAIVLVSEQGEDALSLRKLSAACGVSYAAPYAHFQSKEQLLDCCRAHVAEELTGALENAIASLSSADPETLNELGNAFVDYFYRHREYYSFLFQGQNAAKVSVTLSEVEGNFPPFEVFRKVCKALTVRYRLSEQEGLLNLAKCWALVNGVASMTISSNVRFYGDWKDCL